MRVLLYTPFYPPQSQAAAVRSYWEVKTLKEAGHEVKVLSSIDTNESEKLHFNPADNKQGFAKRLLFELLAGIELFFDILFSNFDLYVLSSPPFITVSFAHWACRLRGKKYLIDVRDIYPDVYFAQGLIKENSFMGRLVLNFTASMYRNAYGVLTVTEGLLKKISRLSPATKVALLMNGFDQELFRPSSKKYEKFTIIFHGNMGKVQNLETILQVASRLESQADIEFIFIGEGPQAELLKASPLKNVRYLGSKSYSEIPELIAKAHVGFSARRDDEIGTDAFPVKAFEYLGVGIPIILTPKFGALTKMVGEGVYEFNNQDIDSMAEKILELKRTQVKINVPESFSRQSASRKILSFCDFK